VLLQDQSVDSYSKYRILHQLIKGRGTSPNRFRFFDQLSQEQQEQIVSYVPMMLSEPAFELNITALYLLKATGVEVSDLRKLVFGHALKPVGDPLRNALAYVLGPDENPDYVPEDDSEPDDTPQPY
jgi:hypothetical protein